MYIIMCPKIWANNYGVAAIYSEDDYAKRDSWWSAAVSSAMSR
jgi:hypothetical protein